MGLSICKLLVEKMRGNIDVKSEKNVGTTFTINISSKARLPESLIMKSRDHFSRVFSDVPSEDELLIMQDKSL